MTMNHIFILLFKKIMWATSKNSRMVSQFELAPSQKEDEQLIKIRDVKSIEGRVVILCLASFYFGYVLTEISLFPPSVMKNGFGDFMTK
jgi:hypothetical protein